MGGKDSKSFKQFVQMACQCFWIVRSHASIFVNLFALMLSTGIPELKSFEDIQYLGKCLMLDDTMTQKEVEEAFGKLIYASLSTKSTQINFFFHNLAH
jgi:hypothetical protein